MKNIKQILAKALDEIRPDREYEQKIFSIIASIISSINKGDRDFKAVLGGSGAKGTWLKTFDADIFVLFNYKKYQDKSDKLSDILEKTLKKKFKITRLHGSRDYFQIKKEGFTFEIVPILGISNSKQARNITDVSPLHSKWVARHKKLANEMKLMKQFCKAGNIYGAESHIQGFSGYVCEILAVYYGSFLNVMKNASKWGNKNVIDVEKYYKKDEVFRVLNTSKLISPLIVIDPVQKDRNASAALSVEKFESFKNAAKSFLKNPSEKFFKEQDIYNKFVSKKGKNILIIVKANPLQGKIDVVGSKLLKAYDFLLKECEKNGFKSMYSSWEWKKNKDASFYFIFSKKPLSNMVELEGPPLSMKDHVANFKKLHKKTSIKRGKIFATEKRKFIRSEQLLNHALSSQYVKDRTKSVSLKAI
ncbi:MAG TPA: nucleotidyltransferase domain-containing protein [Candidatus Nanoarchaeia archaeon]|nr:nucleotidyltransferase domain-containing protein [Candidatus Nanoarchaeia archaeon]